MIENFLKKSFLYPLWVKCISPIRKQFMVWKWKRGDHNGNPPHFIKRQIILELQKKYNISTFIETGTFRGEMVAAIKNKFNHIYSIELDKTLYEKARSLFAKYPHIKILEGDSSKVLPMILSQINEPALFWLDGHYSAGITAKGILDTPIKNELEHIFNHQIKNHVILIDDARLFNGENDYPTISELSSFISKLDNEMSMEITDDLIKILPHSK